MNNKSRVVLATTQFGARWLERLQRLSSDIHIEQRPARDAGEIPNDVWREVEILYTFGTILPAPQQAPRLRWVQLRSAGADRALNSPLFQTPVIFATSSGVHAINVAEYVFAVVLAWSHRFPRMLEWQQREQWPPNPQRSSSFMPEELRGKTN